MSTAKDFYHKMTPNKWRIIHAALHELKLRLDRGLANSGLDPETGRLLRGIHDSEVTALLDSLK